MTPKSPIDPNWLNLKFECPDISHRPITIRRYLASLLGVLWDEQEGFSGKRPFGNSGWENDLLEPLQTVGVTEADYNHVVSELILLMAQKP